MNEETRRFIEENRQADIRRLALKSAPPKVDLPLALTQIEGWQKLRHKVPVWANTPGILYPRQLSLEQCSSEQTALYKQQLIARLLPHTDDRQRMIDLTGGMGVDFSWASRLFGLGIYVERDAQLCQLARHNFAQLGLQGVEVINGDGSELIDQRGPFDLIYLDPARRNKAGRKTVSIADCEPDATALSNLLLANGKQIVIKLSPMLDCRLALNELPCVSELHVVACEGECKELLAVMQPGFTGETAIFCTNDAECFRFTYTEEMASDCSFATCPERYLYEPNAALLKAGAFRLPGARFNLKKISVNSHLYTSTELCPAFPGRTFHIEAYSGFGKKELRVLLKDTVKANLTVRNFPATVAELRKKMKLAEGGDTYLFATTGPKAEKWLIRCNKIHSPSCSTVQP